MTSKVAATCSSWKLEDLSRIPGPWLPCSSSLFSTLTPLMIVHAQKSRNTAFIGKFFVAIFQWLGIFDVISLCKKVW
jgi:hypothetical protein